MHEEIITEILAIAKGFYRLMDPHLSTRAEAFAVTEVSGQVMEALAAAYAMDRETRDVVFQRLLALSDRVLSERDADMASRGDAVH